MHAALPRVRPSKGRALHARPSAVRIIALGGRPQRPPNAISGLSGTPRQINRGVVRCDRSGSIATGRMTSVTEVVCLHTGCLSGGVHPCHIVMMRGCSTPHHSRRRFALPGQGRVSISQRKRRPKGLLPLNVK